MSVIKKSFLNLSILVLTLVITSCGNISSEDLNPQAIKTNYYASYSQDDNKTQVKAEFTIANGFTYVSLDGDSKLMVDGQAAAMKRTLVGQIYYAHTISNLRQNDIELDFVDSTSAHYKNTIMLPASFTHTKLTQLNEFEEFLINYTVSDSQDDLNELSVYINGEFESISFSLNEEKIKGAIKIKNDELLMFKGQTVSVKICRNKSNSVTEHPGRGGYLRASFCAKVFKVKVK